MDAGGGLSHAHRDLYLNPLMCGQFTVFCTLYRNMSFLRYVNCLGTSLCIAQFLIEETKFLRIFLEEFQYFCAIMRTWFTFAPFPFTDPFLFCPQRFCHAQLRPTA